MTIQEQNRKKKKKLPGIGRGKEETKIQLFTNDTRFLFRECDKRPCSFVCRS